MSKIFGISYPPFPGPGVKVVQNRMGASLVRKKWQHYQAFEEGQTRLGVVSLTKTGGSLENILLQSGSLTMVFNGYFIYPDHSGRRTGGDGYALQAKMAGTFLEDFGKSAISSVRKLNGVFSIAIHDREKQEIILVTDRSGLGLLYYHLSGRKIIFASEVKAILEDPEFERKINWKGWSDMFNLNWVSGNDTLFENIYALPPAGMLRFNYASGHHSLTRYWSETEIQIDSDMAENKAFQECKELMCHAVSKFNDFRKEIVLSLSGGNDSRFLALAMLKEGIRFRAMTTNKDNSDTLDLVNSEKLCRLLKIDRTVIELKKDLYSRYFLSFLEDTDFMAPGHIWLSPLVQEFPVDAVVYDGYAGGSVLGHNLRIQSLAEIENLPKSVMDENMHNGMQKGNFNEPYDRIFRPDLFKKLKHFSLAAYIDNDRPLCDNYFQVSKLHNRSRRGIGTYSYTMLNNYVLPVMPFLENDFFSFALAIPNHLRFNYYIFNRIVNEMVPGLESIQTTRMGADMKDSPRQKRMVDHDKTIRLTLDLLKKYRLPDEFLNKTELEGWLIQVRSGKKNPFLRIRPYLYFSLWYNKYFA